MKSTYPLGILLPIAAMTAQSVFALDPEQPSALDSAVYSSSAAEIFWQRSVDDGIVVGYEIRRNGILIETIDALSYFDSSLAPSTSYEYSVVAVDNEGNRSPIISTALETLSAGVASELTSPTGLSASVYSQTAVEIFWDRVSTQVLSYDIYLDGELIDSTDGTSFFSDSLTEGNTHDFRIVAVSTDGSRSAAASIMVTMGNEQSTDSSSDIASQDLEGGSTSDTGDGSTDDSSADTSSFVSTAGVVCDYVDVTYNSSESVNNSSTSEWTCSDTDRILIANGIPDHEVGEFPNPGNPNTISEQDVSASYSLNPTESTTTTTLGGPAGPQGYVLNGVKIDASTAGSCDDTGTSCSLVDNAGSWSIEALGQSSFNFGTDDNNAHVQPDGAYHYHGMPEGFVAKQGGNSSVMTLIAWAADGFPIYARYGYSDANDATSELISMAGSYQLITEQDPSRPSTDTYAPGTFAQDWQYVEGSGDLDECNGRTGVTPEFPGGIYHYYATDSYPYFQRCVKGAVAGGGAAPAGPGPGNGPG